MAENWKTLELNNLVPTEVRSIVDGISTLTSTLTSFLGIVKTGLEITKTFASTAATNPVESALASAVNEIETFIDGLTQSTTAHVIFVPVQKKFFGKGNRIPKDQLIETEKSPTFEQLVHESAFVEAKKTEIPIDTIQFINNASTAQGGSQGFWKALSLSLQDEGDASRPNFPRTHAVAGVCILFGADSLSSLQSNFNLFNQIIKAGPRADLASRTRPTINNVRIKAVPLTDSGRIGVQIDWDPVPPVMTFGLFSDESFINQEVIVVRSTNPRIREKFAWSENFSSEPSDDLTEMLSEGDTKMIARLRNDGFITRYVDTTEALTAGQTYYYALAVRYSIGEKIQPMGNFSAVRRIRYTAKPQSTRSGEPPDWLASPSLIELFPPLEGLINQVRLTIAGLASRTTSNSGAQSIINQTITQIDALIRQGESLLTNLSAITTKLDGLLGNGVGAATSSTVITVNAGGMEGWIAELAKRLSDTTDPSRPAFDNDELVAGIVIVAGAPNLPQLADFLSLLNTLFGTSNDNPLIKAVDAIASLATDKEFISFDDGLAPTRSSTSESESALPPLFDDSMAPTESIDC